MGYMFTEESSSYWNGPALVGNEEVTYPILYRQLDPRKGRLVHNQ